MKAHWQKRRRAVPSTAKKSRPVDWRRLGAILEGVEAVGYAMVFGSAQDGMVRAGSDLDVAISLTEADSHDLGLLLQIVGSIEEELGATCDLTVLDTAGPVLRHEALQGQVLFVRPDRERDFSEFYARTGRTGKAARASCPWS